MTSAHVLLTPEQFKPSFKDWTIKGILNPAAARMEDESIILYVRVAESAGEQHESMTACPVITSTDEYKVKYQTIRKKDIIREGSSKELFLRNGMCRLPTIAHIRRVILEPDGHTIRSIDKKPFLTGIPGEGEYGVEDPRITKIGDTYYMTYVGVSIREGVSTYLASSTDLLTWERRGLLFREQNKDAVLFPEKINNLYVAFHRPEGSFEFSRPAIWISYSPDLVFWGKERAIAQAREGMWDSERIGAGPPPIKTPKGWLLIYHGVQRTGSLRTYRAGVMLFDLKNPEKLLARSKTPLFFPKDVAETMGFVNNVVFPTGLVMSRDKKSVIIYSGGADRVITVRRITFDELFASLTT